MRRKEKKGTKIAESEGNWRRCPGLEQGAQVSAAALAARSGDGEEGVRGEKGGIVSAFLAGGGWPRK